VDPLVGNAHHSGVDDLQAALVQVFLTDSGHIPLYKKTDAPFLSLANRNVNPTQLKPPSGQFWQKSQSLRACQIGTAQVVDDPIRLTGERAQFICRPPPLDDVPRLASPWKHVHGILA
jgi:hypothetical protein